MNASSSEVQSQPVLAPPPADRYACRDCPAKCCRFPWRIDATAEEVARYHAMPWLVERLKSAGVDFTPMEGAQTETGVSRYNMPRISDERGQTTCAFLDDDGLCAIQKAEGHAAIPKTCQQYPFNFAKDAASGEVYPMLSFFCPSVAANTGDPIAPQIAERYATQLAAGQVHALPEQLLLSDQPLPLSVAHALCDQAVALLDNPSLTVDLALLAVRQLTAALQPLLLAGEPEVMMIEAIRQFQPSQDAMAMTERRHFTGRMLTHLAVSRILINGLVDDLRQETQPSRMVLVNLIVQLVGGRGSVRVWDFPARVDLAAAGRVSLDWQLSDFQALLARYFRSQFATRRILVVSSAGVRPDWQKRLFELAVRYAATGRMARYRAAADGRDAVTLSDLQTAVGLLDTASLGFNPPKNNQLSSAMEGVTAVLSGWEDSFCRALWAEA
ncbi:MAG: hypothetical protein AB7P76_11835 [Candidatus Melainabacteria bacterium]